IDLSWTVVGENLILFIAQTQVDSARFENRFFLYKKDDGWRELMEPQNTHAPYGQPLWDGKAFIIWSPESPDTDFLYPDMPDQIFSSKSSSDPERGMAKIAVRIVSSDSSHQSILTDNH